jgi:hypothetical protein
MAKDDKGAATEPKKPKAAPIKSDPNAKKEREERLSKKAAPGGLQPIPQSRRGRLKAIDKNERKKQERAEPFVIPDCMFPKLNGGMTRNTDFRRKGVGDYQPIFCDWVTEWSARGKSRTWMAAELRVAHNTVLKWEQRYPPFAEAMEIGAMLAQRYWEDNGEAGMRERQFSAAIWKTIISARFPKDWQENKKVELGLDTSFLGLWDAVSKGATVVIADEADEAATDEEPSDDDA